MGYAIIILLATILTVLLKKRDLEEGNITAGLKIRILPYRLKRRQRMLNVKIKAVNSQCNKLLASLLEYGITYTTANKPKTVLKIQKKGCGISGIKKIKELLKKCRYEADGFESEIHNIELNYMESFYADMLFKVALLDEVATLAKILTQSERTVQSLSAADRLLKLSALFEYNINYSPRQRQTEWLQEVNYNYRLGADLIKKLPQKITYSGQKDELTSSDVAIPKKSKFCFYTPSNLSIELGGGELVAIEDVVEDGAVEFPFSYRKGEIKNLWGRKSIACVMNGIYVGYDFNSEKELKITLSFPYAEKIWCCGESICFLWSNVSVTLKNCELAHFERLEKKIVLYITMKSGNIIFGEGTKFSSVLSEKQSKLLSFCLEKFDDMFSQGAQPAYRRRYFDAGANLCEINYSDNLPYELECAEKPFYSKTVYFADKAERQYQFGGYSVAMSKPYEGNSVTVYTDAVGKREIFLKPQPPYRFVFEYKKCFLCNDISGQKCKVEIFGVENASIKDGKLRFVTENAVTVKVEDGVVVERYLTPQIIELQSPDLALNLLFSETLSRQLIGIKSYGLSASDKDELSTLIIGLSAHILINAQAVGQMLDDIFYTAMGLDCGLYFINALFDYVRTVQDDSVICNAEYSAKIESFLLNNYQYVVNGKDKYAKLYLSAVSEFISYATSNSKIKLIDCMENIKTKYGYNYKEICEFRQEYPFIYFSDSGIRVIKDIVELHRRSSCGEPTDELIKKLNPIRNYILGKCENPYAVYGEDGTYSTIAATLFYRVILCDILGIKHIKGKLTVEPNLPTSWDYCTAVYPFESSYYHLCFIRGDEPKIVFDGIETDDSEGIPLIDGKTRYVEVYYT